MKIKSNTIGVTNSQFFLIMNSLEYIQSLTTIGVYFSEQLIEISERHKMPKFCLTKVGGFDSAQLSVLVKKHTVDGWFKRFKTADFLKELSQDVLSSESKLHGTLNEIYLINCVVKLTMQMQSTLALVDRESIWSKFMEYRNILAFYAFHFNKDECSSTMINQTTIDQFHRLQELVEQVITETTKKTLLDEIWPNENLV